MERIRTKQILQNGYWMRYCPPGQTRDVALVGLHQFCRVVRVGRPVGLPRKR
jgi:hypothetical protein